MLEGFSKKSKVAFIFPALWHGGVEKVTINLIRGLLEKGVAVDLVLGSSEGELTNSVPKGANIVDLEVPKRLRLVRSLRGLFVYFRKNNPESVVIYWCGLEFLVIMCAWVAYIGHKMPRFIYVIHNVSKVLDELPFIKRLFSFPFTWLTLRTVDAVVGVSKGVADDFSKRFSFPFRRTNIIYNPVVFPEIEQLAKEPVDHLFFTPGSPPVILGAGRLTLQKDFATLIRAFALLRRKRFANLVIFGEGKERPNLEQLIEQLNIKDYVWMPGFVENPYKYMSKASVFVLSSIYEGLPTVLVEALALGVPVVSSDCKSGPREILEDGKYGSIVPIGNPEALAEAIERVLDDPPPSSLLKKAASRFSIEKVTKSYMRVLFGE